MTHPNLKPDFEEPIALFGSDPQDVADIAKMEKDAERVYNNEWLKVYDAPLKYYADHEDVSFIDILSPGEYFGDDVRKWFMYISPQFVGDFGLINMRIYAKNGVGFVYMNQTYQGKLEDGSEFVWKMRQTDTVEKIDGEWKILHTHLSFAAVPEAKHPDRWQVDREYPKRPPAWEVSAKLAGG
ncbi:MULTISPECIES: YybH family protein [Mycobacteriaceae]|uniref:SnoaL-like domain-containing protein n=2 Tax=Mycobacteriaceae TaxID=1762 RepID=A0A3S4RPA7_MYCCI|nr:MULTISPECIES: nuclear transport factor 2 family protein [Mycolicibacterium]MCV7104455.1 nuclear transport factor 2 family protein [Mycolicibacterium chitae]CAJ1584643.1 nuclear transport factor 2 family protein [Mycolicibacterium sp. MU0050]VEG49094.1 Uncharacterised protein [Mycolicibacterium chitae]